MARRLRKARKMRGSRTHGWGRVTQHRDHGRLGGRGKAGWCKNKWTYVIRHGIEVGKSGFKCPTGKGELNTVNVGELGEIAERLLAQQKVREEEGKILLNLGEMGFQKLLGEGIVAKPLFVKVFQCSKSAAKKIEEAGGKIEILAAAK